MKVEMTVLLAVVGIAVFLINALFLAIPALYVLGVAIAVSGVVARRYSRYRELREIESRFPDFLHDIAGNVRAGMTLTQAVRATKGIDYGALSPAVRRMAIQIDWGVPFDQILERFAKDKGPVIQRTVSTILESYKGGGMIAIVLDAIGKSVAEIDKLRKERVTHVYSQIVTGYIIFFVFLGVLVGMVAFLVPSLGIVVSPELGAVMPPEQLAALYRDMFIALVLIQGFFSGLAIGKMSEGRLIAGFKHSLLLVVVGYFVLMLFA
jgi:flagellar protein FlaJ